MTISLMKKIVNLKVKKTIKERKYLATKVFVTRRETVRKKQQNKILFLVRKMIIL